MHVEIVDGEWFWRHVGVEPDDSMLSVDGEDIQGNALAEDIDCVLGPGVQMVVVPVVLHDEAVDVDALFVQVGVQLEGRGDRGHGHWSSSFEIEKPDTLWSGSGVMIRMVPALH